MCGELSGSFFVQLASVLVVAITIVFQCQAKQRTGVATVGLHGTFEQGDHFRLVAAQCRDGRGTLIEVLRRLLYGTG